jgi:branched-chain amino acid transport system ATP-binding protein
VNEPLLQTHDLTKSFGGLMATDSINLEIAEGEIHAIIGPNGAGKTTLIRQITGEIPSDRGSIVFAGYPITQIPIHARSLLGIARSFQITSIFLDFTVLANVALAVQAHSGHSFRFWRNATRDAAFLEPAQRFLELVSLKDRASDMAATLSHGEQRQLELAMALATEPRLLLLDEPTAGMGVDESTRMINLLRSFKRKFTILLIEHDMDAVFALADRITVLHSGQVLAIGTPDHIRASPTVRQAYLGDTED